MAGQKSSSRFHITMYPWFAVGHMTPFLHLANKLAERGHTVSFLLPKKAISLIGHFNFYPNMITFYPVIVPPVENLPDGAETASEIPPSLTTHLATAMDLTRPYVESFLKERNPDFVFYDLNHWIPDITTPLEIKSVYYTVVCAAVVAIKLIQDRDFTRVPIQVHEFAAPPPGYPSSTIVLRDNEARSFDFVTREFGSGIAFYDRLTTAMRKSDAIAIRTCREIEGHLCDYISSHYDKPVYLTGPVMPEPDIVCTPLEEKWAAWLDRFEPGSALFCAFGSQFILEKDQFQELVLGFEMTKLPFFIAVKPPSGSSTIEEALPDGFQDRVVGRGVVHGGWVQQPLMLRHPSVGCFVSHCGFGSMWESLMSDCQIVVVPQLPDQILNARILAEELKVAVEVNRGKQELGFTKEGVCKAIKSVMDKDSELGRIVEKNHARWSDILASSGFMNGYIDQFVENLEDLKRT